jgi:hypothetical protein
LIADGHEFWRWGLSQKETPVMAGVLISASSIAGFEYRI